MKLNETTVFLVSGPSPHLLTPFGVSNDNLARARVRDDLEGVKAPDTDSARDEGEITVRN